MKDRIKRVMESQHMSQGVFASFIEVSAATLSSVYTGRTRPTLNMLEAIKRKIPAISLDWLMFGTGTMYESGADGQADSPASADTPASGEQMLDFGDGASASPAAAPTSNNSTPSAPTPVVAARTQPSVVTLVRDREKPPRSITEIRIFYDDQTWETFVPKK